MTVPRFGRRLLVSACVLAVLTAVPAAGQMSGHADRSAAPDQFSQRLPGTNQMSREELLAFLKVLQINPGSKEGQAELLKTLQNLPESEQQEFREALTRALGKEKVRDFTHGVLQQIPGQPGLAGRDFPNFGRGQAGFPNTTPLPDQITRTTRQPATTNSPSSETPPNDVPQQPFPSAPTLSSPIPPGTGQPRWPGEGPHRDSQLKNRPDLERFLEFWKKNVGPSRSLEKALLEIAQAPQRGGDAATGPDGDGDGGGFLSFLESEGSTASEIGKLDWLEKSFEGESWKFPELGLKDWAPKMSGSTPNWNAPTAPPGGFSAEGLSSGGGSWLPLVLLAAVAAAYVLWRYWPRVSGATHEQIDLTRGPWPVDPRDIADRHALVRAFEYLSVLLCGDAARVWNHRTIATALRARVAGADAVAEELASLYEQARYTPPTEPLPPAALVAARRCLCQLAGVSPA